VVVGYDPTLLTVAGCRPNPEFDLGLCNPQFDRDEDGEPDAARFNVVSPGGLSAPDDVPLNLADITWAVVGRPDAGTVAALEIEVLTFDRWDATPISVTTENGQVTVVAGAAQMVFLPLIGEWRMENGGWRMENGGWRMEDGDWRPVPVQGLESHNLQYPIPNLQSLIPDLHSPLSILHSPFSKEERLR